MFVVLQIWQAVITIAIVAAADYWYITWIVVAILATLVFGPYLFSVPSSFKFKRHAKPAEADRADTQLGSLV